MDKLSFWDKIVLTLSPWKADTDAKLRYVTGDLTPKDTPTAILRDAMLGAKKAYKGYTSGEPEKIQDLFETSLKKRLEYKNVPQRGIVFSPTGADMFDLWNPPLRVPEYSTMPDLWSNKKAQ